MKGTFVLFLIAVITLLLVASTQAAPKVTKARAYMRQTMRSSVEITGTIDFTLVSANEITVNYQIDGLEQGSYPFHVHTYGDLSAWRGDASNGESSEGIGNSVGGHFQGDCDNCRPALSSPLN